jgi:hypothetical protein
LRNQQKNAKEHFPRDPLFSKESFEETPFRVKIIEVKYAWSLLHGLGDQQELNGMQRDPNGVAQTASNAREKETSK